MNRSILLCLFILISHCIHLKAQDYTPHSLLIYNATLLSPNWKTPMENAFVLIKDNRIVSYGTEQPKISDCTIFNAKGKYIIPGLIDCHVHVSQPDGLTEEEAKQESGMLETYRKQLPKSYLYFGYTTLIDLGTAHHDRIDTFLTQQPRPDLFFVGGGAIIGDGYGLTQRDHEMPYALYPAHAPDHFPAHLDTNNHSPEKVVKRLVDKGAIAIKTYYEPGFDPTQPRMPVPDETLFKKLQKAAHSYNLPVLAHANSLEGHSFMANNKVDIITHGLWNWGEHNNAKHKTIPISVKKTLDLEIKNKVAYIPTLQVIKGLRSLTNDSLLKDTLLLHVLPKSMINYYKDHQSTMYQNVFGKAPKHVIYHSFSRIMLRGYSALDYFHNHGGKILFGTDTPSSPTYGNPPGYNGFLEMQQMRAANLPLLSIFKSATLNNAIAFGIDKDFGSIAKGKIANLLLLETNPLSSIEAYNSISHIVLHGKLIERATLSANKR